MKPRIIKNTKPEKLKTATKKPSAEPGSGRGNHLATTGWELYSVHIFTLPRLYNNQ